MIKPKLLYWPGLKRIIQAVLTGNKVIYTKREQDIINVTQRILEDEDALFVTSVVQNLQLIGKDYKFKKSLAFRLSPYGIHLLHHIYLNDVVKMANASIENVQVEKIKEAFLDQAKGIISQESSSSSESSEDPSPE